MPQRSADRPVDDQISSAGRVSVLQTLGQHYLCGPGPIVVTQPFDPIAPILDPSCAHKLAAASVPAEAKRRGRTVGREAAGDTGRQGWPLPTVVRPGERVRMLRGAQWSAPVVYYLTEMLRYDGASGLLRQLRMPIQVVSQLHVQLWSEVE
jgi:hypothetical protein